MNNWKEENRLTGDDIILLKPGDKVIVHSVWSGGWMTGKCTVNERSEINCIHGWMDKDFFLRNYHSYKIFHESN